MADIVPCTREHIENLAPRLREMDREELLLSTGLSPDVALMDSFEFSFESWAVVEDGVVLCVFGLGSHPQGDGWGIPWLLASEEFYEVGFRFARECRGVIAKMHQKFPRLINMVYAKNSKAIRWLKWCGFTFHNQIQAGPYNAYFLPFTKELPSV